jgi:hypothetical protein
MTHFAGRAFAVIFAFALAGLPTGPRAEATPGGDIQLAQAGAGPSAGPFQATGPLAGLGAHPGAGPIYGVSPAPGTNPAVGVGPRGRSSIRNSGETISRD